MKERKRKKQCVLHAIRTCKHPHGYIKFLFQESNKAMKITYFWLDEFLVRAGCGSLESAKRSCIVTLSLTDKSGSLIAPVNYIYPDVLKNADIPVANVTVSKSSIFDMSLLEVVTAVVDTRYLFHFR